MIVSEQASTSKGIAKRYASALFGLVDEQDEIPALEKNVNVLIDPMSEIFLIGTTIDYVKEDYSKGIFENKFVFVPDQTLASTCGCGISFTPKK